MKHKIIFIAAAAAVLATGCDKFLDVHPKGEKINMFETAEEYEDALYGVYSELTGSTLYGQHLLLLPEVMSQNFTCTDYRYAELAEGEMTTNGATSTKKEIWKDAYAVINHLNNIVEHAEDDLYWFERCPSPAPRQSKAILTGLHFHIPYRTMRSREGAHSMAQ